MKQIGMATAVVCLAAPLAAKETRHDMTGFDRIEVADDVKVEIFSGSEFSVISEVSGTARERRLVVEQEGETLSIRRPGRSSMILMGMADYYTVTVHLPALRGLDVSRGADVEVSGTFPDEVVARTSSGADLDMEGVDVTTLALRASSGSDIDVTGSCTTLTIEASSGSDIDGEELECRDVEARASSGSDIEIHVSGTLTARATSGSDIDVDGAPQDVSVEESSGGEVSLPGT
ncbi:head GIN domain-containing protein [Thalassococcus sp. S3]|uniref:head GIN domain-containing protein n=1 Tax=Thalassococcus sp. S3 TaxID=2017482 RepID=UPI0013EE991C|nr:head GIN domain-containing protein [Thalassococcus sp. S3]